MSKSDSDFEETVFPLTSRHFFVVAASEGDLDAAKGFTSSTAGQALYRTCAAICNIGVKSTFCEFCEDTLGDGKCRGVIGVITSDAHKVAYKIDRTPNSRLGFVDQIVNRVEEPAFDDGFCMEGGKWIAMDGRCCNQEGNEGIFRRKGNHNVTI